MSLVLKKSTLIFHWTNEHTLMLHVLAAAVAAVPIWKFRVLQEADASRYTEIRWSNINNKTIIFGSGTTPLLFELHTGSL